MANSNDVIEAAMRFASYGWRVVPCSLEAKHPKLKGWQNLATTDEDQIIEWWSNGFAGHGVSIVFGPTSGVVDIDCDNAEDGDKLRDLAFGGEWPVTPTYLSGRRKTPHRLFRWRDDLPPIAHKNLRDLAGLDIDLKLGAGDKGTHSLAPPSKGYEWLPGLSPDECEVADLPDSFVAWLHNLLGGGPAEASPSGKSADEWEEIVQGVREGSRNDSLASFVGKQVSMAKNIHDRTEVEFIVTVALMWNRQNDPPLPDDEVRKTVSSIIRIETSRRGSDEFERYVTPTTDNATQNPKKAADGKSDQGFRIVRVLNDPVTFELWHRVFDGEAGGRLTLTAQELASGHRVRVAALDQAGVALPPSFAKAWGQADGLLIRLMAAAETREGDRETDRKAIVAQAILDQFSEPRKASGDDGDAPDSHGYATTMGDGSKAIGRGRLQADLRYDPRKVTPHETTVALEAIGAQKQRLGAKNGNRIRVWRLSKEAFDGLERRAWPDEPE